MRRLETSRVQKFVILFTISFYLEVEIIKSKASNTSITSKTSRPEWLQDVQRIRDSHTSKTLTSLISKWSTDYFFTFSVWRGKEKNFFFLLFFSREVTLELALSVRSFVRNTSLKIKRIKSHPSKSSVKIKRQNKASKSSVKIECQNRASK